MTMNRNICILRACQLLSFVSVLDSIFDFLFFVRKSLFSFFVARKSVVFRTCALFGMS